MNSVSELSLWIEIPVAVLLVVSPRWISIWQSASGRLLIRPCSCWKSSRHRLQLCFCAMLDA